jgi:hypothetical protein
VSPSPQFYFLLSLSLTTSCFLFGKAVLAICSVVRGASLSRRDQPCKPVKGPFPTPKKEEPIKLATYASGKLDSNGRYPWATFKSPSDDKIFSLTFLDIFEESKRGYALSIEWVGSKAANAKYYFVVRPLDDNGSPVDAYYLSNHDSCIVGLHDSPMTKINSVDVYEY